jgi:predicted nuclease with TOPRIM domain
MNMAAKGKHMPLLLAGMLVLIVGGCTTPQAGPDAVAPGPAQQEITAKRFQDTPLEGRTPAQSALELSEKYAKQSDQITTLRQENQRLTTENETLQQQVTALEGKLKQTQKELGEANDLLLEMLTELNNWKSNILGFRGEMRQAAQAQLEALVKILEILGGQAEAGAIQHKQAETWNAEPAETQQAAQPTAREKGEPNGAK